MDRSLVIDVGAHDGDDTAHYLARGFRVVAIEASPSLVGALKRRFGDALDSGRLVVEGVGITQQCGDATFYLNPRHSEFSSFDYDIASRGGAVAERVVVPCLTMAEILNRHGVPYFVKIDIEGNDGLCLDALDTHDLPLFVSVEAHRLEYLAILWAKGYRHFRAVDQLAHNFGRLPGSNEHWRQRAVRAALHRAQRVRTRLGSATLAFPPGSSGPIPDEVEDGWNDFEVVAYDWLHHRMQRHTRGTLNSRGWFDFHATV